MGRKIARDKRLFVATDMPSLHRTKQEEQYQHKNDAVSKWISEQPDLLNYVFDKLSMGGYIAYDKKTGTWQGVDYNDN